MSSVPIQSQANTATVAHDLNKSQLTQEVTAAVVAWLSQKGFKPVQTEVQIVKGWIADVAAAIVPTNTELQDLKLIRRLPKYNSKDHSVRTAWYKEADTLSERPYTALVEVKTSRADFTRDHKWKSPQPTSLAYLATQKGLTKEDEWPDGWGILEFAAGALRCLRPARLVEVSPEMQAGTILSLAMRLHNTVNYAASTAWRLENKEREKAQRASEIIGGVCSIVESKHSDFDRALSLSRLRPNRLSVWEKERLRKLFGLGKHVYDELEAG